MSPVHAGGTWLKSVAIKTNCSKPPTGWGDAGGEFSCTPVLTGVSPPSGPAGGGTALTISGRGFSRAHDVITCRFGDASVAAEFNRSSQHLPVGTVEQGAVLPGAVEPAPPRSASARLPCSSRRNKALVNAW